MLCAKRRGISLMLKSTNLDFSTVLYIYLLLGELHEYYCLPPILRPKSYSRVYDPGQAHRGKN